MRGGEGARGREVEREGERVRGTEGGSGREREGEREVERGGEPWRRWEADERDVF